MVRGLPGLMWTAEVNDDGMLTDPFEITLLLGMLDIVDIEDAITQIINKVIQQENVITIERGQDILIG